MKQKTIKALAWSVSMIVISASHASYAQMRVANASTAALGGAVPASSVQATDVLLKAVETVVTQSPDLADSVGDRALVKAVQQAVGQHPDMANSIVGVAKQLKPHLSQRIEMAAADASAFDGATATMQEEAPPAWASAPMGAAPQPTMAPQGSNPFANDKDAPEWAVAAVPFANDASAMAMGGRASAGDDVTGMDLESLMNAKVVTASKSEERAFDVPAAIYVVTNEDIRRSGFRSIPEALRMVPGMQVAQIASPSWSVASRGFGDEFANKLLVMVDGRSVYTPTFSGVYWDEMNMPLEDVERIEVIRGPGATIWGANAVNGVINIVTKDSKYTQGAYLSGGAGTHERVFGEGRSGGKMGNNGYYRMYSRYYERARTEGVDGQDRRNDWNRLMAGFRTDWKSLSNDQFTVQGEMQQGTREEQFVQNPTQVFPDKTSEQAFVRGKWDRALDGGDSMSVATYLDYDFRDSQYIRFHTINYDVDFNHSLQLGQVNQLMWGLGYRMTEDEYENSDVLSFTPDSDVKNLFSGFLQDKLEVIPDQLDVTLGSKLEHNDYTGFEVQPTAKFSYHPNSQNTLWGSVARAVRTPSRVEDSIQFNLDQVVIQQILPGFPDPDSVLTVVGSGDEDVKSEELIAYELGYRVSPREGLVFDIAGYYNDYDNLTTLEKGIFHQAIPTDEDHPFAAFGDYILPVGVGNGGTGKVYGIEVSSTWQVLPSWKLAGYYAFSKISTEGPTRTVPLLGANEDTLFLDYEGLWPRHTFSIRSYYNITEDLELDAALYFSDALKAHVYKIDSNVAVNKGIVPNPIDSYLRGDLRLGWRPLDGLELSLAGLNLLEGDHVEFIDSRFYEATNIGRSYYGMATWRF